MRLINTTTLKLHEFYEKGIPPYAILSHRWQDGETSFKDFVKGRQKDCRGYRKVLEFCEFAQWHGEYQWAWIDTVCIDKRSSAELSEAINSMFNWYANAEVCYAYLVDVDPAQSSTHSQLLESFKESEWFARGWTLQELLAPGQVVFLANDWSVLCRKAPIGASQSGIHGHRSLEAGRATHDERWDTQVTQQAVTSRTGVPIDVLQDPAAIRRFSVAQRMSWAAHRTTTRTEDIAYCLLGIFRINMPLLYGEGRRAFTRLQHEIIQTSYDESIYAWTAPAKPFSRNDACSMLAESPANFRKAASIVRTPLDFSYPWVITRRGLEMPREKDGLISGYMLEHDASDVYRPRETFPILLGCKESGNEGSCFVWIARLRCGHWGRICTENLDKKLALSSDEYKVFKYNEKSSTYLHIDECEDLVAYFERTSDPGFESDA